MKAYYYIPLEHEATLSSAIDSWRLSNPNQYVNISGFYKEDPTPTGSGDSLIQHILPDSSVEVLPYNRINIEDNNENLIGFILEGYIQEKDPDVYAAMIGLSGVHEEEDNTLFKQYLNSL